MTEYTLAIIIPYFKIDFFEKTLASLAQQTDQRFQVYIGDDASPVPPTELLEKYQGKFNVTYKRFKDNLGSVSLVKQWERCIAMMQDEEWFMILGDDDFLSVYYVEEFYKHLELVEKNNINVIKYASLEIDEKGDVQKIKKEEPLIKSSIEHFFDKFVHEGRSSLSEHTFRKSAYKKYGFLEMPLAWHSDDWAQLRFSDFGNILFIKEAQCFISVSSASISGSVDNIRTKQLSSKIFFEALSKNMQEFKGEHLKQLIDLIEWAEQQKNIHIEIKNKARWYYKAFGLKGIYRYLNAKKN